MEYVILRAVHPTWLVLQLPKEVADLIQYRDEDVRGLYPPGRGVAFLARGPGVVRVLPSLLGRDVLGVETARNRLLGVARVSDRHLLNLPGVVAHHLGLKVVSAGGSPARTTDDSLIWFLPAAEYYDYRAQERTPKGWAGPSTGGFAHVYLAKSILESPRELGEMEGRIEAAEWNPKLTAVARPSKARGNVPRA
jgi:hypothetical protein